MTALQVLQDALASELSFYARIFGLEGAGAVSEAEARPFTIDNLDDGLTEPV